MSYQAIIDDEESIQVASNGGWYDFCEWVRTLDEETCPELYHLADNGWEQEIEELADQLREAIDNGEPAPDVKSTAEGLLAFLGANPDAEAIVVTQGFDA